MSTYKFNLYTNRRDRESLIYFCWNAEVISEMYFY